MPPINGTTRADFSSAAPCVSTGYFSGTPPAQAQAVVRRWCVGTMTRQAAKVRHGQGNMVNALAEASPLVALPTPATPPSVLSFPGPPPAVADTLPEAGAGAARWREQLDRRLLLLADITALMLAMTLVPTAFGKGAGGVVLAGLPLALVVFKLGGLYDGDDRRLVPSTLDEIPTLLQLTGLVALG